MMRLIIISNYYNEIEILKDCQTLHESREKLMPDAPLEALPIMQFCNYVVD